MGYEDVELFRGSCPKCGIFQSHKMSMCQDAGCLVLHYYPDIECKCGQVLWKGNLDISTSKTLEVKEKRLDG